MIYLTLLEGFSGKDWLWTTEFFHIQMDVWCPLLLLQEDKINTYYKHINCFINILSHIGGEPGGREGNRPSTFQGGGAHFLLCLIGYYLLILINNTYFINSCLFYTDFS